MIWCGLRAGFPALGSLLVPALLAGSTPVLAQDSTPPANGDRPTTSGVFTDAQARRGEESYKINCVSCHSAKAYTGDAFKVAWLSRTAYDIFDLIRTQMPEDNPGALPRQDYVDIVAYLFSLNGYPTGSQELPGDDNGLKKVKIDAPPGGVPAPAPSTAPWTGGPRAHPLRR